MLHYYSQAATLLRTALKTSKAAARAEVLVISLLLHTSGNSCFIHFPLYEKSSSCSWSAPQQTSWNSHLDLRLPQSPHCNIFYLYCCSWHPAERTRPLSYRHCAKATWRESSCKLQLNVASKEVPEGTVPGGRVSQHHSLPPSKGEGPASFEK